MKLGGWCAWLAAIALAPGGAWAQEAALVGEIRLPGRDVLEVVIHAPYGEPRAIAGRANRVRLVDAIDAALRDHTTLMAREPVESQALLDARGNAIATLRAVRRDVDVSRLAFEGVSLEEHERSQRADGAPAIRLILVLSVLPGEAADRVSALLVDVRAGLELLMSSRGMGAAQQEAAFEEKAVLARLDARDVASADGLGAYVDALITGDLRPALTRAQVWGGLGTIDLVTAVDGAEIMLDGALVGTTRSGRTRLHDVRAGSRSLALSAAGHQPFQATVAVAGGHTAEVQAVVVPMRAEGARTAVFVAGLVSVAAGAAVMVSALPMTSEVGTVRIDHTGSEWQRYGDGGPAVFPLGYSLAIMGGAWLVGPALFEDEGDVPWWSLGVGLALGVIAYGVSELAEDAPPAVVF